MLQKKKGKECSKVDGSGIRGGKRRGKEAHKKRIVADGGEWKNRGRK